jgi:hypothetical protein
MRPATFVLALSLAVPAAAQAKDICLTATQIDHTTALSDNELLIYMNDGKIWKNTLKTTCPGLKFENGVKWEIRGATICANMQKFTVLRRNNFCFLGEFTPYTPPPQKAP